MGLIEKTLKERDTRYGGFLNTASTSQALKVIVEENHNWLKLDADVREAIHNIFTKIARIVNGDQYYIDNYLDIEGYARLVRERIEGEKDVEVSSVEFDGMVDFLIPDPGDGSQDRQDRDAGGSSIVGLV